jgi:hypothetical protein
MIAPSTEQAHQLNHNKSNLFKNGADQDDFSRAQLQTSRIKAAGMQHVRPSQALEPFRIARANY